MDAGRAAAAGALPDRIAFLGLGLIGGSIAMAIREAGYRGTIAAWTPVGRGPAAASASGAIDHAARSATHALDGAGLVVLAAPPLAVLDTLEALAGPLRSALSPEVTITDVASTKVQIVDRAANLRLPFVGGHPMAGRETSGFEAASADLLLGRPWVVIDDPDRPHGWRAVMDLAAAAGAAPVSMPAEEHDAAVAAISHVPLVLSAALVESVTRAGPRGWRSGRPLAAGGWRDMTRLARGDPEMGAGILATNSAPIAAGLRAVRETMNAWIAELEGPRDAVAIQRRLEAVKAELEVGS